MTPLKFNSVKSKALQLMKSKGTEYALGFIQAYQFENQLDNKQLTEIIYAVVKK